MKNIFSAQTKVVSTVSKRIFGFFTPCSAVNLYFHSPNVIYLVSSCSLRCIRDADQMVNEEFGVSGLD